MAKKSVGGYPLKKFEIYSDEHVHEERDGKRIGLANGLVFTHFLNELCQQNFDKELPDDELNAAIDAEYPNRGGHQGIAAYRSYFNQDVHGHGNGNGKLEGEYRLPRFKTDEEIEEAKAARSKSAKANAKAKTSPKKKAKAAK